MANAKTASFVTITDLNDSVPLIRGTQAAITGAWTGVAPFRSLENGQQISYLLPFNGSGNAALNLTLDGGGTTGAIACYYGGTSRLTTQYGAGNIIRLTYIVNNLIAGTNYTGWWADANYVGSDTYDRVRYNRAILAKTAITASRLIVSDSGGYFHLAAGSVFDIDKPILYAGSAITAGATGTTNYSAYPSLVLTNNFAGVSFTNYKTIYLRGTISGNLFTVDATAPVTDTPTNVAGKVYMVLGQAYSTTGITLPILHELYMFHDGVLKTTSQIASNAIANAATAIANAATAQGVATTASSNASTALTNANAANTLLADMANDNRLTPAEKSTTTEQWNIIQNEKNDILNQATIFNVSSAAYLVNFDALDFYLNNATTGILLNSSTVSNIDISDYRTLFQDYYRGRLLLLNNIAAAAKIRADEAFSQATGANTLAASKNKVFHGTGTPIGMMTGDLWIDAGAGNSIKRYDAGLDGGAGAWVSADHVLIKDTLPLIIQNTLTPTGIYDLISQSNSYIDEMGKKALVSTVGGISQTLGSIVTKVATLQGPYENKSIAEIALAQTTTIINNLKLGGRNLVRNSGTPVTLTNAYILKTYTLSQILEANQTYTISIKASLGLNRTSLRLYNADSSAYYVDIPANSAVNGIYTKTFICPTNMTRTTTVILKQEPSAQTTNSTVEWVMLQAGQIALDWTLAPEDLDYKFTTIEEAITTNSIVTTVRENEAYIADLNKKTDADTYNSFVTAQGVINSDLSSSITQLPDNVEIAISETYNLTQLNNAVYGAAGPEGNEGLNAIGKSVQKFFEFSTKGLTIRSDAAGKFKTVIDDERMGFWQGTTEVAYISNSRLHIPHAGVIETITIGDTTQGMVTLDVVNGGFRGSWTAPS